MYVFLKMCPEIPCDEALYCLLYICGSETPFKDSVISCCQQSGMGWGGAGRDGRKGME